MKWGTLFFVFVLLGQFCAAETVLTEKWKFDTGEEPDHVFVLNVDENPSKEVIVGAKRSGIVFAVDWAGAKVWRYSVPGILFDFYVRESPDQRGEVLAGSFTRAYSVNRGGDSNWKYFTQHNDVVSVFLDDFDADGGLEAVIGVTSWRGNGVTVLNESGSDLMTYGVERSLYPYVFESVDLDGDKRSEVVVGFTGYSMNTQTQSYDLGFVKPSSVKVVSLSGSEVFSFSTAGGVRSVGKADLNGDGLKEIVVGSRNRLYVLDRRGSLVWDYVTGDLVYDLDFADLDGDGEVEVVAGGDKVYALRGDGSLLWESKKYAGVFAVKVADLDGDDIPEVIAGSTRIVVYDSKGELIWSSGDFKEVTDIAVADLNLDGYVEVLVSSKDGKLRLFETEPYAKRGKADKLLSDAMRAYNVGNYSSSQESAAKARFIFQELGDAKKAGEAETLASNSKDHAEADAYFNESVAAYAAGDYDKAVDLSGKASSIYSRLKDAQALGEVKRIYERSRIRPNAEGNYSKALELAASGDFANASHHARTAFSAYRELNETELAARAENMSLSFEKHVEADEYYDKAEELYTWKKFSEAEVYLTKAREVYREFSHEDGLTKVEALEAKIKDTGTVKKVFVLSGVGLVIILLIGLIMIALLIYLRLSKKENKDKKEDLNQEGK